MLNTTTDTVAPWVIDKILTLLVSAALILYVLGVWLVDLYKLIPFEKIFNNILRLIDVPAKMLVLKR